MNYLLTVEEVAQLTGLSVNTIYRYASHKILPNYKISNRLRFKKEDIEEWLNNHK